MTADPFRDAVAARERRMRYIDLAQASKWVRSSSWFNNVVNGGSRSVGPPPPDILYGFAELFGMTTEQVAAMVAESWYGVRANDASDRVRRMAPALDALPDEEAELAEALAARLATLTTGWLPPER